MQPLLRTDGKEYLIAMTNNLNVPESELKNYANKLLQRNCHKIKRENLTNELLMSYIRPTESDPRNKKQKEFDFNQTTFPLNPLTVVLISKIRPEITTLKATLKPETNPENFILAHTRFFNKLKSLHLTLTDGLTYFDGPKSELTELKLYFQLTCHHEYILRNILSNFPKLQSLTICEGTFTYNTMNFLEGSQITRLSIKNPIFDSLEDDIFIDTIRSFNLKILKLIVTLIPNQASYIRAMKVVARYINELPHPNLQELSITMPNDELNINYLNLVNRLPELKTLRLFISCSPECNDTKNLIPFFQNVRPNLKIILCYYKFHSRVPKIAENRILLEHFQNVTIKERKNPYITYTQKLDPNQRFIVRYRKMKNYKLNMIYSSSDEEREEKEKNERLKYPNIPSLTSYNHELITEADSEIGAFIRDLGEYNETLIDTITSSLVMDNELPDIYMDAI